MTMRVNDIRMPPVDTPMVMAAASERPAVNQIGEGGTDLLLHTALHMIVFQP